ncbi:P-loop containing nucleoside triphosphate hydrolase protein, partial [Cunninghamella echinulata]
FNFSDIHQKSGQERIIREEEEDQIITSLHTILKPFLLRRLKTDVEHSLPKKKEYLLYAPLTISQKQLYDAIIKRDVRDYLIKKKTSKGDENKSIDADPTTINGIEPNENKDDNNNNSEQFGKEDKEDDKKSTQPRKSVRALQTVNYKQSSDRAFFNSLKEQDPAPTISVPDNVAVGQKYEVQTAIKHVNSLHLQNIVMQLRKVCNHPFLFDWPIDPKTNTAVLNNDLAAQSGKVLLLDRLLTALFDRGHKVLVFSQMTKMLDILEDWATALKGWPICRLDGSVSQEVRRQQIDEFNDPTSPVKLFLLSTRAGGLGINLTGADTVIIFDSDWNPQMDLQAQDRVHRIGQKKPVLVYRFVAANTVEAKILERATAKRRLEKLVISKGKFKTPISSMSSGAKKEQEVNIRELAEILASEDGEQVQIVSQGDKVISDEDLEKLLDRSEHVFESQNTSISGGFRELGESEMKDDKNEILATRA